MLNFNIVGKLKLIFNFGKKKQKAVGILNEGKHNTFVSNKTTGFDVGMYDRGEDTRAIDNEFNRKAD